MASPPVSTATSGMARRSDNRSARSSTGWARRILNGEVTAVSSQVGQFVEQLGGEEAEQVLTGQHSDGLAVLKDDYCVSLLQRRDGS